MIKEIKGDLVEMKEIDIFCHQTNCFKTMGAGIAKRICQKYPEVRYKDYDYQTKYGSKNIFGTINCVKCSDGRICVNMYAQYAYGRDKRYTDYDMFQKCLDRLAKGLRSIPNDSKIGFPKNIGCGLAGGDWNKVLSMIEDFATKVDQDVYIVEFSTI